MLSAWVSKVALALQLKALCSIRRATCLVHHAVLISEGRADFDFPQSKGQVNMSLLQLTTSGRCHFRQVPEIPNPG